MGEKCVLDPERDCLGITKANEVAGDMKALDRRLDEFQHAVSDTNSRFGARIGKLEAHDEVRDEQYKNIREKLDDITRDVTDFQREQKGSITDLRKEHKESMEELRKGNKEILDIVTPLKHKVAAIDQISGEIDEIKEKPGKRWESIVEKVIGLVIAAVVGFFLARIGL